jgi:hypothetical protein
MACVYQCKSPFGAYRQEPCRECKAEYDRYMDESYEYYQRKKAVKAFRAWLKSLATDWDEPSQVARTIPIGILEDSAKANGITLEEQLTRMNLVRVNETTASNA